MANQSLGDAVSIRLARSKAAALDYKLASALGRYAPRRRRLSLDSAIRRSLVGVKGIHP